MVTLVKLGQEIQSSQGTNIKFYLHVQSQMFRHETFALEPTLKCQPHTPW
jgi:hypothetical protein